ncbi:hypothetical protein TREAZ_1975 [Leadbettera azotonutricia ZAS-9]|uniref:Uncharacterized protein n=1 Tax=Leadbettera azotonutricia (strain ATCC BAA-888 / DSM 13862 / ZAS-9) TaxID=545695 RepID=F5YAN0_LEAAZ|nr:hypothetical protein TREAZ_1975 [Leadbettera azotonutricia ZAS-9]
MGKNSTFFCIVAANISCGFGLLEIWEKTDEFGANKQCSSIPDIKGFFDHCFLYNIV